MAFKTSVIVDKYKRGEKLVLTNENGTTVTVHFTKCTLEDNALKYVVKDKNGIDFTTYKQYLKRPDELDISTIPIKPMDYE